MGTVRLKASAVVTVIDGYEKGTSLKGVVSLTDRSGKRAIRKTDNCFVFINLPMGENEITITSSHYQKKIVPINIGENVEMITAALSPGKNYKYQSDAFFLDGRIKKGETAQVAVKRGTELSAVGECKKGESSVRIYSEKETSLDNTEVLIFSQEQKETFRLESGEEPMEYILNKPAEFDINNLSQIYEVYNAESDENGRYFLAVGGGVKDIEIFYKDKHFSYKNVSKKLTVDLE